MQGLLPTFCASGCILEVALIYANNDYPASLFPFKSINISHNKNNSTKSRPPTT